MNDGNLINSCPVCASSSFNEFLNTKDPDGLFDFSLFLLKCRDCGLVFLKEAVKQDCLYQKCYYRKTAGLFNRLFDFALNIFMSDRYNLINSFERKTGSILDVGCGDASFLLYIKKKGWKVFGVDSSLAAVDSGKDKDIPIIATDLLDSKVSLKDIDVITYWYCLEHLINPKAYMNKTYDILKNAGLLIVSVQNIDSLQFALFNSLWFHLDLPRHLLHFTPATLKKFLSDSGFDCLNMRHDSLQMNFFGWFQSLYNVLGFPKNLFYKTTKRGTIWTANNRLLLILMLAIAPYVIILSIMFCLIEVALGRGGVITAIARKHV